VTAAPAPPSFDYPPEEHVLRDLRLTVEHRPDRSSTGWLPAHPHQLTDSGRVRAGIVATLVDVVGGGLAGLAARPDWIATADLTLHLLPRPVTDAVEARGRVLRAGRSTVVIEVALSSEPGDRLGVATMSFAVLPRRDENPVLDQVDTVQRMTMEGGSRLAGPILDRIGVHAVDPARGVIELPYSDYVRNTLGAVQGGMMATAVDAAAQHALTEACGTPVETTDLQVTYLALAKVGPVRSRTRVLTASADHGIAHVELVDAGAGDRLTTLARVVAVRAS
jgi:uncharacterized protein (TIGR00369 family)